MSSTAQPALKTVLLVDDEPEILQLMQFSLRGLPLRIATAPDGEEALAWMREHAPDLVVLDVMMPKLDGAGVYDVMRKDERLKNVPVLIVSVIYSDETMIRGSSLVRLPSLRKPFSPVIFADRVLALLGQAP